MFSELHAFSIPYQGEEAMMMMEESSKTKPLFTTNDDDSIIVETPASMIWSSHDNAHACLLSSSSSSDEEDEMDTPSSRASRVSRSRRGRGWAASSKASRVSSRLQKQDVRKKPLAVYKSLLLEKVITINAHTTTHPPPRRLQQSEYVDAVVAEIIRVTANGVRVMDVADALKNSSPTYIDPRLTLLPRADVEQLFPHDVAAAMRYTGIRRWPFQKIATLFTLRSLETPPETLATVIDHNFGPPEKY